MELTNALLIDFLPAVKEISVWWNSKELTEQTHFKGMKYKKLTYPKNGCGKTNETFIRGEGYVKGKIISIPKFSGFVKDYESYINKYGSYCLYHSLTNGRYLDECDICTLRSREEFNQLVHFGIEKFLPYMEKAIELDKIVYNTILSYYPNENDYWFKEAYERFKLVPQYHLMNSCFPFPANMDITRDDNTLLLTYCEFEWIKMDKDNFWKGEGESEFMLKIMGDSENGIGDFPVGMSERIRLLYGKRAMILYESLLSLS